MRASPRAASQVACPGCGAVGAREPTCSLLLDNGRLISLAGGLFPDDMAVVQRLAAETAAIEERELAAVHAGPELLYRLEHTAALYLIVGGLLARRLDELEAAGARPRGAHNAAPMRQRYARLRILASIGRHQRDRHGLGWVRYRCARCWSYGSARGADVRNDKTRSCGCLRGEHMRDARRRAA